MSTLTIHFTESPSPSLFRYSPADTVWLAVSPARTQVRPEPIVEGPHPVQALGESETEWFEQEPERWDGLS